MTCVRAMQLFYPFYHTHGFFYSFDILSLSLSLCPLSLSLSQRSISVTTPPKRRYSREFEDLPPRLYTYSSTPGVNGGRSPLVRSIRSNTRTPSLEEMPEITADETRLKPNYK